MTQQIFAARSRLGIFLDAFLGNKIIGGSVVFSVNAQYIIKCGIRCGITI